MDALMGQMDESSGQMDSLNVLNGTEMVCMSNGDSVKMYLGAGGVKYNVRKTDGIRSSADVLTDYGGIPSVGTNVNKLTNAQETIKIPQKKLKLLDSPESTLKWTSDKSNSNGNCTDVLTGHREMASIQTDVITTENAQDIISTP